PRTVTIRSRWSRHLVSSGSALLAVAVLDNRSIYSTAQQTSCCCAFLEDKQIGRARSEFGVSPFRNSVNCRPKVRGGEAAHRSTHRPKCAVYPTADVAKRRIFEAPLVIGK